MMNLLILGAGGMGKEVFYTAQHSIGYGTEFIVKGFLDYPNPNWNTNIYPPIICVEDSYEIQSDDVFVCSVGDVQLKKRICEKMKARGAKFQTLISTLAQIHYNVTIGEGSIIDKFAVLGSDSIIGDCCLVQVGSVIGHDVTIGDYTRIDCHVLCVGGTIIGNNVCIHTNSVINHGVTVCDDSTVGAMSFVIRKVKQGTTVQGNPARILK